MLDTYKENNMIKQLLSGSLLRVIALVITSIIAFFMMPFLIHNLGDRYYGLWVIIGSIASYYGIFSWGIISALDRFIAKHYANGDWETISRISSTSFVIFSVMGVIVLLLSIVSIPLCNVFLTDATEIAIFKKLLIISGFCLMVQFTTGVFSGILSAFLRYDLLAITEILKAVFRGALIVLAISNDYGLPTLAMVLLITDSLAIILQVYFVKTIFPQITFRFDSTQVKELLGYGIVSSFAGVTEMLRVRLIPIFVASLNGVEFVVVYSIALRLMEYFQQFIRNAIGMFVPVFSLFENDSDKVKKVFNLSLTVSIIITLFMGYSVLLYSKSFITLWVGTKYTSSYTITTILTLPFVIILAQTPIKELFYGVAKQKYCFYLYIAEIVLFFVFSIVFNKYFGFYGIAVGFLVSVVIPELVVFPTLAAIILKIKVSTVYNNMVMITIKTSIPFAIFYFIYQLHIPTSYLEILLFGILQSVIFLIALYFLILPIEIKELIKPKFKRIRRIRCIENC